MERIGKALGEELDRFGPQGGMAAIVTAWPDLVGPALARNAWPARVGRDGTLHVNTSSAAWAYELGQLAPMLLERLREALPDAAPAALRFALGPVPQAAEEPDREPPPRPREPTAEERRRAEDLVAAVDNEELRNLLTRAAAAALARSAADRSF